MWMKNEVIVIFDLCWTIIMHGKLDILVCATAIFNIYSYI